MEDYDPTIEDSYRSKKYLINIEQTRIDGTDVHLEILDTAGQVNKKK